MYVCTSAHTVCMYVPAMLVGGSLAARAQPALLKTTAPCPAPCSCPTSAPAPAPPPARNHPIRSVCGRSYTTPAGAVPRGSNLWCGARTNLPVRTPAGANAAAPATRVAKATRVRSILGSTQLFLGSSIRLRFETSDFYVLIFTTNTHIILLLAPEKSASS